jgi:hypothetical protein
MKEPIMHTARCLCGAITVEVDGELKAPDVCHCGQCRRWSGHCWASTDLPRDRIRISGADNITWYQSSEKIRRGFCKTCGAAMFWDPPHRDWTAIAMGAFETPTGTHVEKHIFVANKGDYYAIAEDEPQELNPPT